MGGSIVSKVWKACFQWVEAMFLMGEYKAPALHCSARPNPSPQTFVDQNITSFGEGFENERRTGDSPRSLGSAPALFHNFYLLAQQ